MDLNTAASALKELGHPTRLAVYKALVKAGRSGLPVGELQAQLDIPASTLSHHLSALLTVGLIRQERQGRTLFCLPQYQRLEQLLVFLVEECCSGAEGCTMSLPTQLIGKPDGHDAQ